MKEFSKYTLTVCGGLCVELLVASQMQQLKWSVNNSDMWASQVCISKHGENLVTKCMPEMVALGKATKCDTIPQV